MSINLSINVSKMDLKNRVPTDLLNATLTENVPICALSQAIQASFQKVSIKSNPQVLGKSPNSIST